MKNYFALALAWILAAVPARGEAPLSPFGGGLGCGYCVATEVDRLVALLGDPVLRELICRLSSARYTPDTLGFALGVPEAGIMRRINTLRGWGLARAIPNQWGRTIIEAAPGNGANTLRRWASRYCPHGDECGRPLIDPRIDMDRHAPRAIGLYSGWVPPPTGDDRRDAPPFDHASGRNSGDGSRKTPWEKMSTERERMVAQIVEDMKTTAPRTGRASLSNAVLKALSKTPRHEFVPPELRHRAYENNPLPIGDDQTISQPYIVALMTEILDLEANDVVLEVGTGSGYQTAILAFLVSKVYTIEIIDSLHTQATERLKRLGYRNIETRHRDGYIGWRKKGPFDAIIVTAAADEIPELLIRQLAPGGKMAIVVGQDRDVQKLVLVEKKSAASILKRNILPVRFVPLKHDD